MGCKHWVFKTVDDIGELAEKFLGKDLEVVVYNTYLRDVRTVTLIPSNCWGGFGLLGCKVSMGVEYTIPSTKSQQFKYESKGGVFSKFSLRKSLGNYLSDVNRA